MSKVVEIAVTENPRGQMKSVNNVEAIAGKGLVNHYHFKNDNEKRRQLHLSKLKILTITIKYQEHLFCPRTLEEILLLRILILMS